MSTARKIILISIDTLRFDHLGCYGYDKPTSPFLDTLAKEGTVFERHYATDVPTPPSYTALFTGQRGLKNGILGFGQLVTEFKTKTPLLAEHFADAGYRTGMISNLLYPMPWLVRGFKDIVSPGLRFQRGLATEVTEEASRWLKSHSQGNFFLFLHYWDPHSPYYKAPQQYQDMFSPDHYRDIAPDMRFVENNEVIKAYYTNYHNVVSRGETRPERLLAWYDSAIRYVDDSIKNLFALLRELNLSQETLVLITSDHGEAFGEYGFFDHISCYENVAHLPFIFRWPGKIVENRRIKGFSSEVDVMPTLLELAGLPVPENICGKSLTKALSGKDDSLRKEVVVNTVAAVIQRMYVEGNWALVHTLSRPAFHHIKEYELFNLAENRLQETDVSEKENERLKEMRLALGDWLARELRGGPDLLHSWVEKGGWAWAGVQRILHNNPGVLLKDPELKKILIKKFGPATRWLERGKFEYETYYPGM